MEIREGLVKGIYELHVEGAIEEEVLYVLNTITTSRAEAITLPHSKSFGSCPNSSVKDEPQETGKLDGGRKGPQAFESIDPLAITPIKTPFLV